MPRYMVEHEFAPTLDIAGSAGGSQICRVEADGRATSGQVTWVHIYMSKDKKKSYCVYDAPSSEAILRMAQQRNLPEPNITEVMALNPYF
jgi:hypothetical protein